MLSFSYLENDQEQFKRFYTVFFSMFDKTVIHFEEIYDPGRKVKPV